MQGASGWARVVFRTCSKGPTPERDLNSNFLPGFKVPVNFLLFLFGSVCQVSMRHPWAC